MDQRLKAFIVIFTISVSIYVIYLMTSGSENSFLNADGGRNTANQKLMIVDQSTGEISFVKKSLSGINQNFTKEDNEIKEALKLILGNNLKGDTSGFIKTLKDSKLDATTAGTTYATKTELAANKALDDDRLKSLEGSIVARMTDRQARDIAVQVYAANK